MGWAHGLNNNGREIGYGVSATCDMPDCEIKIDRGMTYLCGASEASWDNAGMDSPPYYCGDYFCENHMEFGPWHDEEAPDHVAGQICSNCADEWYADHKEYIDEW